MTSDVVSRRAQLVVPQGGGISPGSRRKVVNITIDYNFAQVKLSTCARTGYSNNRNRHISDTRLETGAVGWCCDNDSIPFKPS